MYYSGLITESQGSQFEFIGSLGEGALASVYKVRSKFTSNFYTIKQNLNDEEYRKKRNVNDDMILRRLDHDFVVKLYGTYNDVECGRNIYCYITEYLGGGTLENLLEFYSKLQIRDACFYLQELIVGLQYLHSKGIVHKDLKPENILLDLEGHIRITNFEYSLQKFCHGKKVIDSRDSGTLCYMAPELIKKEPSGYPADWYALGVIFYRMILGRFPFPCKDLDECRRSLPNRELRLPHALEPNTRSMMIGLLETDQRKRLGCCKGRRIKMHPFFDNTIWSNVSRTSKDGYEPPIAVTETV